jgi:sulfatase maturation enzyme AslB (radical SAM superfamily)
MYTTKGCENCEAKWHCGGGCFYMRRSYGSEYMEVFCDFTRRFVKEAVLRRYERLYERLIGVPPGEDWGQTKGEYKILSAI